MWFPGWGSLTTPAPQCWRRMDNEDKVERQSAGKEKKKANYTKAGAMWAQRSGELHQHPPPIQHKHKRYTALHLWGRPQRSAYWMKQDQLESIFSSEHTLSFSFFLSTSSLSGCNSADVACTTRSRWDVGEKQIQQKEKHRHAEFPAAWCQAPHKL